MRDERRVVVVIQSWPFCWFLRLNVFLVAGGAVVVERRNVRLLVGECRYGYKSGLKIGGHGGAQLREAICSSRKEECNVGFCHVFSKSTVGCR